MAEIAQRVGQSLFEESYYEPETRQLLRRVLSALAPAGGYQSLWGTLLLLGGMKRDAVPGMSINGRQASV